MAKQPVQTTSNQLLKHAVNCSVHAKPVQHCMAKTRGVHGLEGWHNYTSPEKKVTCLTVATGEASPCLSVPVFANTVLSRLRDSVEIRMWSELVALSFFSFLIAHATSSSVTGSRLMSRSGMSEFKVV